MQIYDISQELLSCSVYPADPAPTSNLLSSMENGDLYTCGDKNESADVTPSSKGRVIDLVFPIAVLIIT